MRLETLGDEIAELENVLSGVDQRVVFCHNDLQYGNIMIYEETRQVTLIVSSCYRPDLVYMDTNIYL